MLVLKNLRKYINKNTSNDSKVSKVNNKVRGYQAHPLYANKFMMRYIYPYYPYYKIDIWYHGGCDLIIENFRDKSNFDLMYFLTKYGYDVYTRVMEAFKQFENSLINK